MTRYFFIHDIQTTTIVETTSRKELLTYLDCYIDNHKMFKEGSGVISLEDDYFEILYKDGTIDIIDEDYDGHKVKKQNIASIVYTNANTYIVYGSFEINEYGVVTSSNEIIIDEANLTEIGYYIQ